MHWAGPGLGAACAAIAHLQLAMEVRGGGARRATNHHQEGEVGAPCPPAPWEPPAGQGEGPLVEKGPQGVCFTNPLAAPLLTPQLGRSGGSRGGGKGGGGEEGRSGEGGEEGGGTRSYSRWGGRW